MKPIKPIELSASDHRRILHWARLGAIQEIEDAEAELARHVAIKQWNEAAGADVIPHRFGTNNSRDERINHLRDSIAKYRATLAHLITIASQYREADNERSAQGIAEAILANRADERRAEEAKKIVPEN